MITMLCYLRVQTAPAVLCIKQEYRRSSGLLMHTEDSWIHGPSESFPSLALFVTVLPLGLLLILLCSISDLTSVGALHPLGVSP